MISASSSVTAFPEAAAPIDQSLTRPVSLVQLLKLTPLVVAGALLMWSIFLPYWEITLHAPQYPKGITIVVNVDSMGPAKNVREVDGLNHYIGMMKLDDAAKFERQISLFALPLLAALVVVSFFFRGWLALAFRLPVIIYPLIFIADLFGWLYYAGHSLDKHAPLSSSIHEFTPRLFGHGTIGQFSTDAVFRSGFWAAVAAALITLAVVIWDWRSGRAAKA